MQRFRLFTIALCLLTLVRVLCAQTPHFDNPRVQENVDILLGSQDNGAKFKAIDALIALNTPEAMGGLRTYLTQPGKDPWMKQRVLLALGKHGTPEAVIAIAQFERWAESRRRSAIPFDIFAGNHPPKPDYTVTGADGKEWALVQIALQRRVNPPSIWLLSRRATGKPWEPPIFLGPLGKPEELLHQLANGTKSLAIFTRDFDHDRLPDVLEKYMGTNPNRADSDRDGIPDELDGSPLMPNRPLDEKGRIRQAAFTYLFAVSGSSRVLFQRDTIMQGHTRIDAKPTQQYRGYSGWVVPLTAADTGNYDSFGLAVIAMTPTTAKVRVDLPGHGDTLKLQKKHGHWVVVGVDMAWIS